MSLIRDALLTAVNVVSALDAATAFTPNRLFAEARAVGAYVVPGVASQALSMAKIVKTDAINLLKGLRPDRCRHPAQLGLLKDHVPVTVGSGGDGRGARS